MTATNARMSRNSAASLPRLHERCVEVGDDVHAIEFRAHVGCRTRETDG